MTFSIITVCFNCKDSIIKTIRSVFKQSCSDYEYLIIDGDSEDGTKEIIRKYEMRYPQIHVVSEPDDGIYDAMNKGVRLAKGDYVYFLNSGDSFYNSNVLENVKNRVSTDASVYFGRVKLLGLGVKTYPSKLNLFWLVYREKMICHQAIFARRDTLVQSPFDLKYKICADRDWLIKCVKSHKGIESIQPLIVAKYDPNGTSSCHSKFVEDSLSLARKYGGEKAILYIKLIRGLGYVAGKRYDD